MPITATVSDWQGLVNALNNKAVRTIKLTGEINVTNNVNGITRPLFEIGVNPHKLHLTGTDISGAIDIDGQGNTINFGDNYLSFDTANQKNSDPWDIDFKNLTINANGYSNGIYGGAFSPIYMGGDDIKPSLLAKNKVTFENVNADIKNGDFFVTTMPQVTGNDPYTTATFKGTNNITCEAVNVAGSQQYNYSSTVMASHIIFADGTKTTFNVKTTKTNNSTNAGGSTNADSTYDGFHYAPISLGVGFAQSLTNADSNTLTDNGILTIKRTSSSTTAPLISFGSANSALEKGTFTLNVSDGATLDLQDAAQSTRNGKITNTPFAGLITMFGGGGANAKTSNTINITNPAYVNLQRTGAQTGSLIRLENMHNKVNVQSNGGNNPLPLAQWDEGRSGGPSYYWYINGLNTQNNWGDHSIAGFAGQGQTSSNNTTEGIKLLHSNGVVALGGSQAGKDQYQYHDGTITEGQPNPGIE